MEAVSTMTKVAVEVEASLRQKMEIPPLTDDDITSFLSRQAVLSETRVGTKAIFTDAFGGIAARFIASFRGNNPTFAICHNMEVYRWLALSYGVSAYYFPHEGKEDPRHSVDAVNQIVSEDHIGMDDRIAYLTGTKRGTRALEILTPGEILNP